jgi:hypothetical protein
VKVRRARIALIVVGVALFGVISGVLARYFSAENVEREREAALLQAQAEGNVPRMLDQLTGCRGSASCVATVRLNAARLRRPGGIKILSLTSSTNHSLTSSLGETRLAWTVIGRLPIVQCVEVRRSGNFLTGISVALLRLSPPIGNTADCPGLTPEAE